MESAAEHVPARQPGMPYREDCWSDGETSALVDAWGERYLELNRGSLRQKQWQEVADAVNSRIGMTRRKIRTDVQCKNRIDTLKKKYKQEKAKIVEGTALTSQWPFYSRLDVLIGPTGSGSGSIRRPSPAQSPSPPMALPLPFNRNRSTPLPAAAPLRIGNQNINKLKALPIATAVPVDDSFIRKAAAAAAAASSSFPIANSFIRKTPPLPHVDHSFIRKTPPPLPPPPAPAPALPVDNYFIRKAAAAAAAAKEEDEDDEEDESESNSEIKSVSSNGLKRGKKRKAMGDGIIELAKAIDKMGEMYERVEEARQKEMMEMEKQRMELIKGLELQRMQMFADLKVQIEKMKKSRSLSQAGDIIGSVSAVSFLMNPSFL